jgi:hypothetical protein
MAEERVSSQGFYEMLWDCDHCDTKGLLGKSQRHCPECGAKQNADKRYFPKEGEARRVDGHKYDGADRVCMACTSAQSAKAHNCTNCGSPLDGANEVRGVAAPVAKVLPKRRIWLWVLIIVGILAIIIGVLVWYFGRTKEAVMVVKSHTWEREIRVEEYGDEHHTAWRNELPSDARMVSCHRAQRSSKQIPDGETCRDEKVDKKDGTYEVKRKCTTKYRSEPVYDENCNYTVSRWHDVPSAALKKSGLGTSPVWHDAPATTSSRRPGKRSESLNIEFADGQSCDDLSHIVCDSL